MRKLADEQNAFDPNGPRLTVHTIYDKIKGSNSSLGRKSRWLLESSIGRVVTVFNDENEGDESASIDGDFGAEEEENALPESNVMNKNIVRSWAGRNPTKGPSRVDAPPLQTSSNMSRSESIHGEWYRQCTNSVVTEEKKMDLRWVM